MYNLNIRAWASWLSGLLLPCWNLAMNLIIVDIQPIYFNFFPRPQSDFLNKLSKAIDTASKVFWYFNDEDMGESDTDSCVINMIRDYIKENRFEKIEFIEKQYGFLRDWMDNRYNKYKIIETIQVLKENNLTQSTELEEFETKCPIWIPDIKIPEIDFAHICGGCDKYCLAEMEILLEALGIKTKRLPGIIF